ATGEKDVDDRPGLNRFASARGHRTQRRDMVHAQAEKPDRARLKGRAAGKDRMLQRLRVGVVHYRARRHAAPNPVAPRLPTGAGRCQRLQDFRVWFLVGVIPPRPGASAAGRGNPAAAAGWVRVTPDTSVRRAGAGAPPWRRPRAWDSDRGPR